MEKWTNAIEHYNSGITVFFHNKKNYSQSLANCYLNLADAYSSCDKSDEALKYYKKSLKIKSLKYNKSNREIFDLQYSIADSYLSLSNYKNALKYLILWWENTDERKGGPAYEAYTCYKELNEPHEALYWLEQTALLRKERLGDDDERTINTINEILEYAKELNNNDIINKWSINNLN
jgi:tetratricopeptide (TPR) repeat protein